MATRCQRCGFYRKKKIVNGKLTYSCKCAKVEENYERN